MNVGLNCLQEFIVNCKINYQELYFSKYMNLLLEPTLIMVISFMIKHIISFHETLESIQHNTCLAIAGAIRGALKKSSSKNQVWSHSSYDIGIENQEYFTKFAKAKVCKIFLTLFRMGLFADTHGWVGQQRSLVLESVTHILQ